MKRILGILLVLLILPFVAAAEESDEKKWLWDISLIAPSETAIERFEEALNISFDIRSSGLYKTKKPFRIQSIPFEMSARAFEISVDQSDLLGIEAGIEVVYQIEISHESVCNNDSSKEEFYLDAINNINTLYTMLVDKLGAHCESYCMVLNGEVFGTYKIKDSQYPNREYFVCPMPAEIEILTYEDTKASFVTFNYCWENVAFCAGFSFGESAKISFEIEEVIGSALSSSRHSQDDYFDYIREKQIGITSF